MGTLHTALGPAREEAADPVREAARRLARALPKREDCAVLVDFLEDDLREGLTAAAEVEAHFANVLDVLASERPSPIALIEASDDLETLRKLEYLLVVVAQMRRRLSMAAGKLRDG